MHLVDDDRMAMYGETVKIYRWGRWMGFRILPMNRAVQWWIGACWREWR